MSHAMRAVLWSAALFLPVAPASAQVVLHAQGGPASNSGFGSAVARAGDVDGDGFEDFIVGAPTHDTAAGVDAGSAAVYSGRTGAQLYSYLGTQANARYGRAVSTAGDFDGDGHDDFMIGWNTESANAIGGVDIYSGRTGALLGALNNNGGIGKALACAGDVNGDGRDDIVVGFPEWSVNQLNAGMVGVFSWQARTIYSLYYRHGSQLNLRFGSAVASLPDIDQDGVRDLIVGAPGTQVLINPTTLVTTGGVQLFSGANGAAIRTVVPTPPSSAIGSEYGACVDWAGDVDQDGVADLVVGAPAHGGGAGRYEMVSGATGLMIDSDTGSTAGNRLGASVAGCGDVNADGYDDVAVGVPGYDSYFATDCGSVFVYSGRFGNLIHDYARETAADAFGTAVARAGDVNGDGIEDLLAGAIGWENPGPLTALHAGQAVVLSPAMASIATGYVAGRHNVSVARAGDLNGDHRAEYVIATWGPTGSVQLKDGTGSSIFVVSSGQANDGFGTGLAVVGDVSGDGVDDIAVGASWDAAQTGRVYLFSGVDGRDVTPAPLVGVNGSGLGHAIDRLGDVDGDGTADFVVGEPLYDRVVLSGGTLWDAGRVRIVSGATGATIRSFRGNARDEILGSAVAGLGDVSGDGIADVAVGIPERAMLTTGGQVQCFSGANGALLWSVDGSQAQAHFGHDLANAGDVDGDGLDDVIASAPWFDSTVVGFTIANRGVARILSGATGALIRWHYGATADDLFGYRVAGAGDVDHDGRADYVVGAQYANGLVVNAVDRGGVYVYSGATGALLAEFVGEFETWFAGADVAGIGDVDNDGFDDVLFGVLDDAGGGSATAMLLRFGGFRGVAAYGGGTPGCSGPIRLNASAPATLNNALFALSCTDAPPNAIGLGMIAGAGARIPNGADLLGLGVLFHLHLLAYPILTYPLPSNAQGYASVPTPIPNLPLAGARLQTQVLWIWPSCATGGVGGLCTSNGLEVTLQR